MDSLVNEMYENKSLKYVVDIYDEAHPIVKEVIENVSVKYMIICDQNLCDIQNFIPKSFYEALMEKRSKALTKENDIRTVAIDKVYSPLSKDARAQIL